MYKIIARKFNFGKGTFKKEAFGPIVVSKEAFFLVIEAGSAQWAADALGGLVGRVIYKAVSSNTKTKLDAMECCLSELPTDVTGDPQWPIKKAEGRVIVIPRHAIKSLNYPWWSTLCVETSEQKFNLAVTIFFRKGILKFLRDAEWDV